MTSARSSRSRPASGRPLSATARGPTPFASGAPGSPALTPAQPSGPLATTPAAFSSPVPTVAAHALPPGPSRSSPAGLGPAPAPQGAIALTRMPSGSRTGSAGSSGGASGRSALVARGQPSGAARAAGAPAAAAAARGPLVRGPSLGRTEPRPAGEVSAELHVQLARGERVGAFRKHSSLLVWGVDRGVTGTGLWWGG